jgi:hypothetical protein
MRASFMIAVACGVLVATAFLGPEPAEAAGSRGAYCLEYNEGGTDCSFTSLAQCDATASGINAECDAVAPQAAMQEPGAYAFYHPDASLGIEAAGPPERAMAAMPMRSRHASRAHRNGHGT